MTVTQWRTLWAVTTGGGRCSPMLHSALTAYVNSRCLKLHLAWCLLLLGYQFVDDETNVHMGFKEAFVSPECPL